MQLGDLQIVEHEIMQGGASAPNTGAKAHDGVAMSVGEAFRRADAATFNRGADDGGLKFDRKNIHRGRSEGYGLAVSADSGKSGPRMIYGQNGQSSRGQSGSGDQEPGCGNTLAPLIRAYWGTRIRTGIAATVTPGVLPLDHPPNLSSQLQGRCLFLRGDRGSGPFIILAPSNVG
jgi:hypothetical protein